MRSPKERLYDDTQGYVEKKEPQVTQKVEFKTKKNLESLK